MDKYLVEEIHKREMKIIIDGVFNHCSWEFFAFEDVMEKGEKSNYIDWFYDLNFPVRRPQWEKEKPGYACFAYEPKMPKLNTSNEEVQRYFSNVGTYWIREYHIDGWRLDVANEIDRSLNPQLYEFVQKIIKIRKEYIEEDTSYEVLWEETDERVLTFVRDGRKGRLFVSLNVSEMDQEWNREEKNMILASTGNKELLEAMGYKLYL